MPLNCLDISKMILIKLTQSLYSVQPIIVFLEDSNKDNHRERKWSLTIYSDSPAG